MPSSVSSDHQIKLYCDVYSPTIDILVNLCTSVKQQPKIF